MRLLKSCVYVSVLFLCFACGASDDESGGEPNSGEGGDALGGNQGTAGSTGLSGLLSIEVKTTGFKPLMNGTPKNFVATGVFEDGTTRDLSQEVEWSSSDETIVNFSGDPRADFAAVSGDGKISVIAEMGGVQGQLDTCTYPSDFSPYLRPIKQQGAGECPCSLGSPIPYVYWENAHYPDGSRAPLRFGDLHCDEDVSIMIFVVGTLWCGACTSYAQRIAQIAPEIEAAGGRIIFIELENNDHAPCTSEEANRHLSQYIGNVGIRVGDADTQPGGGGYMASSGVVRGYPTVVVVRRSDMRIIADDSTGARDLNLVEVARNPDRDWTVPAPPMVMDNCDGQEEAGEPNDTIGQATPLSMGVVEGGICNGMPDFYRVGATGAWRLSLDFQHGVGDLDVHVWDEAQDSPLRDSRGEVVGSAGSSDQESFESSGPALIRITGFQGASAPYQLTLEEL